MSAGPLTSHRPIVVDLFAGAGGLSLGFSRTGFEILAWVEKDCYASQTLRENHPALGTHLDPVIGEPIEMVDLADVQARIRQGGVNNVDVLIGGPPCKGFSRSNSRNRTLDNPLNSLYLHFLAFARALKPSVVVMENVGDIRYFAGGKVVDEIRCELRGMGYQVHMETLDAASYGVPQVRHRTIIVAHRRGLCFCYPEPSGAPPPTVWDAISDLPIVGNGNLRVQLPYATPPNSDYQQLMRGDARLADNNLVTRNGSLCFAGTPIYRKVAIGRTSLTS